MKRLTGFGVGVPPSLVYREGTWIVEQEFDLLGPRPFFNWGPTPVIEREGFAFAPMVYGITPDEARAVSVAVFNALHRCEGTSATITGGKVVYVPLAQRTSGPIWNREPETEWPRFSDVYTVVLAEWAKP